MKVTVAVLAYNEEHNIGDLLTSMVAQDLPIEQYEVLLVDNCSTDRTLAVAGKFRDRLPNLRIVSSPVNGIAQGRNLAIRESRGDLIAFTDADVILPPTWLTTLVDGFEVLKSQGVPVAAVGGGNVIPSGQNDTFIRAVGVTLNSFWGSHGSTQGMILDRVTEVPHIPTLNILYDKAVLTEMDGFDEDFRMVCEDPELNHRLGKAGYKIYYLPGTVVQHKMRPTLRSWLRNVFIYGRGRTQLIRKHHDHFTPMYAVPPLIALALLSVVLAPLHWIFLLPLIYFIPPFAIGVALCLRNKHPECVPWAALILALNPLAYGFGMLYALFRKKT